MTKTPQRREIKKPKKQTQLLKKSDLEKITLLNSQEQYLNTIKNYDITFCYGPAGTSKTFTACLAALQLYIDGKIDKIILSKPIHESGEKLGFLPGDVNEKIDPFMESYRSNLVKLLKNVDNVNWLETIGVIEYRPLAYMRGATFDNCLMILDESQNANFKQLMLFITRLGNDSKALICGDISQSDISREQVALPEFINLLKDIPGIAVHNFTELDVMRKKILKDIINRYENWKTKNANHKFLK